MPWVAKRPHSLNAPIAARGVALPGVVPIGVGYGWARFPPPVCIYRYSVAREIGRVLQISSLGEVLSGVTMQECATSCLE